MTAPLQCLQPRGLRLIQVATPSCMQVPARFMFFFVFCRSDMALLFNSTYYTLCRPCLATSSELVVNAEYVPAATRVQRTRQTRRGGSGSMPTLVSQSWRPETRDVCSRLYFDLYLGCQRPRRTRLGHTISYINAIVKSSSVRASLSISTVIRGHLV